MLMQTASAKMIRRPIEANVGLDICIYFPRVIRCDSGLYTKPVGDEIVELSTLSKELGNAHFCC